MAQVFCTLEIPLLAVSVFIRTMPADLFPGDGRGVLQLLHPFQLEVPDTGDMDQAVHRQVLTSHVACHNQNVQFETDTESFILQLYRYRVPFWSFYLNADPDPESQANADPCRLQILRL